MACIMRMALIGITAISFFHDAKAQAPTDAYATNYFFEEPPSNDDLPKAPPTALEVIHAKVRVNSVNYIMGRHNLIQPPPEIRGAFRARVQLAHVSSGKVAVGSQINLHFGVPGTGRRYKYPHTPAMKTKEYFIVAYLDHNGRYWLLGSPVSEQEYEPWQKEVYEYERARSRANARP